MYSCPRLTSSNYFEWKRYLLPKQLNTYPICMLRPSIHQSNETFIVAMLGNQFVNFSIIILCLTSISVHYLRSPFLPPLGQFRTVRGRRRRRRRRPWMNIKTFIWSHCSTLLQRTFTSSKSDSSCLVWVRSSCWPFANKPRACRTSKLYRVFLVSLGYSAKATLILLLPEHLSHLWLPLYSISFSAPFLCPNQFPFGVSCLRVRGGWGGGNSLCCHLSYYFGISSYI